MIRKEIADTIQWLKRIGLAFDHGLSEAECLQIEEIFQIAFPPDLRLLYKLALPVSSGFVHWRRGITSKEEYSNIRVKLDWPWEGMVFDIQHNSFWMEHWGEMPKDVKQKIQIAKKHYASYPKLIPIYSHRYIPQFPQKIGNPIFSVYQMDIIYYGANLWNYFENEFQYKRVSRDKAEEQSIRKINFWSEIAEKE